MPDPGDGQKRMDYCLTNGFGRFTPVEIQTLFTWR